MFKRLFTAVMILAFGVASAFAAQAPTTGKIVAIEGNNVQIALAGEMPTWIKKGAVVKIANEAGNVVEPTAKVAEFAEKQCTVTFKDKPDLKVGDTLILQKGKVTSGC